MKTGPLDLVTGTAAEQTVRNRAVLATTCSFTLASASEPDTPIVWVNPAFTVTTGYAYDEAIGRNHRFLQGPRTDASQVAILRQAIIDQRPCTVTLLNYRKDGSEFWNQISTSPVPDELGTVTHFVGIQTDVTERIEAERERELAREGERMARAEAEQARADAESARKRTEQLGRRLALVAEATGLLASTLDIDESMERLARLVVPLLADWVIIRVTDVKGRLEGPPLVRHRDGQQGLVDRYRTLSENNPTMSEHLRALLAGAAPTVMTASESALPGEPSETHREMAQIRRQLGERSLAFVPLTARRRVVGTMTLIQGNSGRHFDPEDLDLAADLGRRAGLAIDNARLYTREHTTALTLQRSLLPILPQVPGLRLAADYLPAGQDSEIGGDWWDVFPLPEGATGLTIGDVMGHDIGAAAAMGQLRSVLRTCAWAGDGAASVLDQMDRLVQGFDMAQLATCFYARLEHPDQPGEPHRLKWCNAGHLPPVLLEPDGRARLLSGGGGVPIGVPSGQPRGEGEVAMVAGATLLLYTDGLVETRTGDIYADMERLVGLVSRHEPARGPQVLVDRLVTGLPRLTDDVAVLAVQVV